MVSQSASHATNSYFSCPVDRLLERSELALSSLDRTPTGVSDPCRVGRQPLEHPASLALRKYHPRFVWFSPRYVDSKCVSACHLVRRPGRYSAYWRGTNRCPCAFRNDNSFIVHGDILCAGAISLLSWNRNQ